VDCAVYLDDFLLVVAEDMVDLVTNAIFKLCNDIGVKIATDKLQIGTKVTFLGIDVDLDNLSLDVAPKRRSQWINDIKAIRHSAGAPLSVWDQIVVKLTWGAQVLRRLWPQLQHLFGVMYADGAYEASRAVPVDAPTDQVLSTIIDILTDDPPLNIDLHNARIWDGHYADSTFPIKAGYDIDTDSIIVYTDASGFAAGAIWGKESFSVKFPVRWAKRHHINFKELYCIYMTLLRNRTTWHGCRLLFLVDSQVALAVLLKRRSPSSYLHDLVTKINDLRAEMEVTIMGRWVDTDAMRDHGADKLSRLEQLGYSDEYQVAPEPMTTLEALHPTNVDACTAPGGHNKLNDRYSSDIASLAFNADSLHVNPPYSDVAHFLSIIRKKLAAYPHASVRIIAPLWPDRSWCKDLERLGTRIHTFPCRWLLFQIPAFSWKRERWELQSAGPIRWPVGVWVL
jgi:hypothetical protein